MSLRWLLYGMLFLQGTCVAGSSERACAQLQGAEQFFVFLKNNDWDRKPMRLTKVTLLQSARELKVEFEAPTITGVAEGFTEFFNVTYLDQGVINNLCVFCDEVLCNNQVLENYRQQTGKKIITIGDCRDLYNQRFAQQFVHRE